MSGKKEHPVLRFPVTEDWVRYNSPADTPDDVIKAATKVIKRCSSSIQDLAFIGYSVNPLPSEKAAALVPADCPNRDEVVAVVQDLVWNVGKFSIGGWDGLVKMMPPTWEDVYRGGAERVVSGGAGGGGVVAAASELLVSAKDSVANWASRCFHVDDDTAAPAGPGAGGAVASPTAAAGPSATTPAGGAGKEKLS